MSPERTVLHVDMDAFYASIEQRDRPELRGKPVIVGGTPEGRGVVCAASYEARVFGVHSAMPAITARRLCPEGVFLPLRMSHYAAIGRQIRDLLLSFTPLVEPLSLDEAFLDLRGCEGLFGDGLTVARRIKDRVRAETDLIASVGVGPNKFLAKLASDLGKPDGLLAVPSDGVAAFLAPLPVGRLWGVGKKAEARLHALGLRTVGQLASWPETLLADHFGTAGRQYARLARGLDDRPVVPDREAKSLSTETTFGHDLDDPAALRSCLLALTEELAARLRRAGVRARAVGLKLRSADFRTLTRSAALPEPTNRTDRLWDAAAALLGRSLTADVMPIRLLGVAAARLVRADAVQGDLFEDGTARRQQALDQALDAIRGQFGRSSIRRGTLFKKGQAAEE
jgi:DNA polymerase-4